MFSKREKSGWGKKRKKTQLHVMTVASDPNQINLWNVLNERETVEKMKENAQVHVMTAACDPDS